jgi:hypothetical protein
LDVLHSSMTLHFWPISLAIIVLHVLFLAILIV